MSKASKKALKALQEIAARGADVDLRIRAAAAILDWEKFKKS